MKKICKREKSKFRKRRNKKMKEEKKEE